MLIIIPTGHSDAVVRRIPWVTVVIAAICLLVQIWSALGPSDEELGTYLAHRQSLEEQILYDYEMRDTPAPERRAFLAAFVAGDQGDPDDERREEYTALMAAGQRVARRLPMTHLGYRPGRDGVVRMVTSAFVHGGWLHLLGNLLFLYLVGCNLEDRWTRGGFVALYLVGALVAAMTYGAMHRGSEIPLIGASGAVSAAMGAFLVVLGTAKIRFAYFAWVLYHTRTGSFSARAYVALPLWFVLQLLNAALEGSGSGGGVAYSAHVGGFVFGVVVGGVMRWSGWDKKLDERDDEVVFDAARGIGTEPGLLARLRDEPASAELAGQVDRHIQEAARGGRSGDVLDVHRLVMQRADLVLQDRSLVSVVQAAAEHGESELAVSTVRTLMETYPRSPFIPRALWDAADVQHRAGRPDLARKTLHNLATRYPDDPFAQQARQRLS